MTKNWKVDWCVVNVRVTRKHNIVIRVSWASNYVCRKWTDVNNPDMYLTDNIGNRYMAIGWGESADETVRMAVGSIYYGTFTFPPAQAGATIFTFHDSDNGVTIDNLILVNPLIKLLTLKFHQHPLELEYRSDLWESFMGENGEEIIQHTSIPHCEMREGSSTEIKGKLKNQISIGSIVYDIYGWLEPEWGIREYVYVSGLEDFKAEIQPLLLVTVPFDHTELCLNDVSEVLSKLYMAEP